MIDLEILGDAVNETITNLLIPAFQFFIMYVIYTLGRSSFYDEKHLNHPKTNKRNFVLGVLLVSFIMGCLSYETDKVSSGYYDGYHYEEEIEEVIELSQTEKLQKSYSTFLSLSFLLLLGGYNGNKKRKEVEEYQKQRRQIKKELEEYQKQQ